MSTTDRIVVTLAATAVTVWGAVAVSVVRLAATVAGAP